MHELHFPWLEIAVLLPLAGSGLTSLIRAATTRQTVALLVGGLTFLAALGAFEDFSTLHVHEAAGDKWRLTTRLFGREAFVVDEFSAPLLPLIALLYLLTNLATLRTKLPRVSFGGILLSESLALALFSSVIPWQIVGLTAAAAVVPFFELRSRQRATGVYVLHMGAFVALLIIGWIFVDVAATSMTSRAALALLFLAFAIRCGIFPFHLWLGDLFENASFATALLYATPLAGVYALVRLLLPTVPHEFLQAFRMAAVFTAIYSSGMATVQRDVRRFVAFLFTSHSSLVLAGLALATPHSMTGALCLWFSIILATGGFGLTLRSLEARYGRLNLTKYLGLYGQSPVLAICFILTGLASVGFPGTLGFIATDLLVDGAISANPIIGALVAVVEALNGIAILRAYFILFTGTRHEASISLNVRPRERLAVLTLCGLILGGGIYPQPGVSSRHEAAEMILAEREKNVGRSPRSVENEKRSAAQEAASHTPHAETQRETERVNHVATSQGMSAAP